MLCRYCHHTGGLSVLSFLTYSKCLLFLYYILIDFFIDNQEKLREKREKRREKREERREKRENKIKQNVLERECVFDLFYHILIYFHLNHHNARHSSGLNLCFPLLFNVSICGLRAEFHPSKVEIRVRVPADALFIK